IGTAVNPRLVSPEDRYPVLYSPVNIGLSPGKPGLAGFFRNNRLLPGDVSAISQPAKGAPDRILSIRPLKED
ncbi:hypothetical protein LZ31DRAFT_548300, partial [Colletotrichum somersetense]